MPSAKLACRTPHPTRWGAPWASICVRRRAAWPLVVVTGAFEPLGFVTIAFARRYAPMAVVTPVSSLAAAFTVLYVWAVLHERPPWPARHG